MFFYTVRRLIGAVLLLIVMSMVTYLIFFATPTDPARLTCGKNCTPAGIEQNRKFLGYDQPLRTQYVEFVGGLFHERKFPADEELQKARPDLVTTCAAPCLGYSPYRNEEIWTYLKPKVPVTASIVIGGFLIWIFSGVLLGIVAALFRGRFLDRAIVAGALVFYSFPTFFISLLLLEVVVFQLGWLQVPSYVSPSESIGSWAYNLILPCLTLALVYAAAYIRLTRTYMLETMNEDYLRTARSKGLPERTVVFKHTLRAALTPIVTISGLDLGALLAGVPITETVFNFQGLGLATVQSVQVFDLPTLVVIVLLSAVFVIVANLIVDLLYAVIDPRVRY
ncbi:peptide/nickel transport system permease protein [Jatrophihabitans sp. GAS493]|uniref:ABC transporter permease n=1 Tax=Jatrophihabitans sp. GAS493 TaxID=1907575 RepID=UPI000BB68FF0|nr:ABC transporter permease [Jatrophihabitans sp. GAS493]SOD75121.1 peptide/nickel transport system permease protein [Jatrophihabitans sp. GAS493]